MNQPTATLTLTDFLLARIAEDGAAAEYALAMWSADYAPTALALIEKVEGECKAKRAIVERAADATVLDRSFDEERAFTRDEATDPYLGDVILRTLAAIYADHPDYREEWAL